MTCCFRKHKSAFAEKAANFASCHWRRKPFNCSATIYGWNGPDPSSAALFVSLKGRARGARMTLAGLRSLFRYHRQTTGVTLANPHRFRHTFASDMVRAGVSLPALMQLMGHADIQTTLHYAQITPQDVYLEYGRAVAKRIRPLPVMPQ